MSRRILASFISILLVILFSTYSFAGGQFNGAWPYSPPPVGHFNTFVTNNLSLGIYWDLMEQPLAMYLWATGKWIPLLAVKWSLNRNTNTFRVYLRKGVRWQDGKLFTSKDVVTTFYIGYLYNWAVWRYIDRVSAIDDYTVDFHMSIPASPIVIERYILRTQIRSDAVYSKYASQVITLINQGKTRDSEEMKKLRSEFDQFRPERLIGTGPFILDPKNLTEAEVTLTRFDEYWDAKNINIDKIRIFNGETPAVTPLVLSGEVDYATHGFPPATERQFVQQGIRIVRPPTFAYVALIFNHSIYPLNVKEVRQAIAYAFKRDEAGYLSRGDSAKKIIYMSGMSDNLAPQWLSEAVLKRLNRYDYNPDLASKILTNLGFKKGPDGIWVTDKGQKMEFEILVAAEYADSSATAEYIAGELTKFGIKCTVRTATYSQVPTEIRQGRFHMAIQVMGAAHPHAHFSYYTNLVAWNYPSGFGPGINFPLTQNTKTVGKVDLDKLVTQSAQGYNILEQKKAIEKLALAFNELLPHVPVWDIYGNNPVREGIRVTGWLPDKDLIYKNPVYADNFAIIMILNGTLKGVTK
ncbi:MAG: ABC transporter substrate-binding protein [bacterium]|nr:ABC transporter substrate-binding protein [bacterium]